MRLAFCMGMVFIWLPLFFLANEFRAASIQSARVLQYPEFGLLNNIAITAVEIAGLCMVLGSAPRHNWAISSITLVSGVCGVAITIGLLLHVAAKIGLFH
jgi:hypothetical protein